MESSTSACAIFVTQEHKSTSLMRLLEDEQEERERMRGERREEEEERGRMRGRGEKGGGEDTVKM